MAQAMLSSPVFVRRAGTSTRGASIEPNTRNPAVRESKRPSQYSCDRVGTQYDTLLEGVQARVCTFFHV